MTTPRVIDLSYPIAPHFRWNVERRTPLRLEDGHPFQVTWLGMAVHGFTHIDAPRHMVPGGPTSDAFDLNRLVGRAHIVDLSAVAPNTAIDGERIAAAWGACGQEDFVILKVAWDTVESLDTPEFWTRAPYLTRDACEWLLAREPKVIGFDFPQDYPIRGTLTGEHAPIEEFVTHDVLLRNGVLMIEYLCNLSSLSGSHADIVALPMKVPDADGAPARVIALAG